MIRFYCIKYLSYYLSIQVAIFHLQTILVTKLQFISNTVQRLIILLQIKISGAIIQYFYIIFKMQLRNRKTKTVTVPIKKSKGQKEKQLAQDKSNNQQIKQISQIKKTKPIKKVRRTKDQLQRIQRSKNQRMFLLGVVKQFQNWQFEVLGNSGTLYMVYISNVMRCLCHDYCFKRKPCKHIYFIVTQVAKCDQLLSTLSHGITLSKSNFKILDEKLNQRLKARMIIPQDKIKKQIVLGDDKDCAICFQELQQKDDLKDCKQCKKYFHQQCIKMWSQKNSTCPLCRFDLRLDDEMKEENVIKVDVSGLDEFDPLRRLQRISI